MIIHRCSNYTMNLECGFQFSEFHKLIALVIDY